MDEKAATQERLSGQATPTAMLSDLEGSPAASEPKSDDAAAPARTISGWRWVLVCMSLYVSIFVYGLDTTIAADVQGPVVESFQHVEQLAWLGAGFSLGSIAVLPFVGVLYASFDIKLVYLSSLILFEAGSALCGAAPTMSALIVGRILAGSGGAGVYLGNLNYYTALTTEEERGTYLTGNGFFWGIGAVLGPVVGGSFVQSSATWRFAFYINLFIAAAFAPMYLWALPSHQFPTMLSITQRLKRIDLLGSFLFAGFWASFTLAFTMPGGQWKWSDGRTIATIVIFAAVAALFALQQVLCVCTDKETRAFPIHLLRSKTQILLFVVMAANITALFVPIYFIPVYFMFVHDDSALDAAVRLLPFVIVSVTVNIMSGHLLANIKYYMPMFVLSGVFIVLGCSLITAYLDPSTPARYLYGFSVLLGLGTGITQQLGYVVATLKAPKDMGAALAFQNIAQIGGIVIGLVIAGQVFQTYAVRGLTELLAGTGFTHADIQSAVAGAQSRVFDDLDGTLKAQAVLAITKAIQKVFILPCVGGGAILVAGLLMKREKLFA